MKYIDYIEIENFKGFNNKVHVSLNNPSVLIGPNNSGKTTVLQALSLWNRAVKAWLNKKGSGHKKAARDAVGINRLLILDIPVKETRYFWNSAKIRKKDSNISFSICVSVCMDEGIFMPLKMIFSYRDPETLYSKPDDSVMGNSKLLETAGKLNFNLLYPMSGLSGGDNGHVEETMLTEGRINVLLGQGQTTQVLRNLCYKVWAENKTDWENIKNIMLKMFSFQINDPKFDETRGSITLDYKDPGSNVPLEISLAGRGAQQMLLLLAYLYIYKNGILLIDEPDAHLEILRQKQVFNILKDISKKNKTQIIIATHSEVILDEAVENNLSCIVDGKIIDFSSKQDAKVTLKELGIQHYYNALVTHRLLITEGSSDVDALRAFATKLNHPVKDLLDSRLFTLYIKDSTNNDTDGSITRQLETIGIDYRKYFQILKKLDPELKAIAIRDGDGTCHPIDRSQKDLEIVYWDKYEIENYFITPELLIEYVKKEIGLHEGELFAISEKCGIDISNSMDETIAHFLFGGDLNRVKEYYDSSPKEKEKLLSNIKMSEFANKFFCNLSRKRQSPILLNKGEYYQLIDLLPNNEIPKGIIETLDHVYSTLKID